MNQLQSACDARRQILGLACEASLYRAVGTPSFLDLVKRTIEVAGAAASAGIPLETPYSDLFAPQRCRYGRGESLGWHYRRAFALADGNLDPHTFFFVTYANNFVTIESTGQGGTAGSIRLHPAAVEHVFDLVRTGLPSSYSLWAHDPYPVGGSAHLLRMDDPDGSDDDGHLRLDVDGLHPCRGSINLGSTAQECQQLAAFSRLEKVVLSLFATHAVTPDQRALARQRAAEIRSHAHGHSFFPPEGFCFSCGGDVTQGARDASSAAFDTGCFICGRSWCD